MCSEYVLYMFYICSKYIKTYEYDSFMTPIIKKKERSFVPKKNS